jgi:hypothetical protein
MSNTPTIKKKDTCFVVMGFGKKTDFESGRVLDLDKSYRNMIKPAVEDAGLICVRADEIAHSGIIDVPMYEQLLNADVVVADLSTSNKNAIYELGIRHALRPFTTVIIAEDGIKVFPFDINHIVVRQYHHLGEDIGFDEVVKFRQILTKAIKDIRKQKPYKKDSPVYTFLDKLNPPAIEIIAAVEHADKKQNMIKIKDKTAKAITEKIDGNKLHKVSNTHSMLMQKVDDAQNKSDWKTAKKLLSTIRQQMQEEAEKQRKLATVPTIKQPEDPYILQRLALLTYKSKVPTEAKALEEAHGLLDLLNPDTSNDTETLGLWGAVHKRLWALNKNIDDLDKAIRAYERGFYLKNDYYNGINFAFLLNVRAAQTTNKAAAIADFVNAQRVRKEVLTICEKWLEQYKSSSKKKASPEATSAYLDSWYWVKATMGEAYLGLGEDINAKKVLKDAYNKAPHSWMQESTEDQLKELSKYLAQSPLQFIKED